MTAKQSSTGVAVIGAGVAVIGAGVVGLSTAVHLQEVCPNLKVTIIADEFTPNTTSDVAAGVIRIWRFNPHSEKDKVTWSKITLEHCRKLNRDEGPSIGIVHHTAVDIYDAETKERLKDFEHEDLSEENLNKIYPGLGFKYGGYFHSFIIECQLYLPWLMNRFKMRGGNVINKSVQCFEEIANDYDVIVNCSGLGARQLAGDPQTYPIRGQVFRVKAPWIKTGFAHRKNEIYILPCINNIVVGGVYQNHNWDSSVSVEDGETIWQRACQVEPSLKYATIETRQVGLRPGRASVCLERQNLNIGGRTVKVVHNYGHAGSGVELSWGCAVYAVDLIVQCFQDPALTSHL